MRKENPAGTKLVKRFIKNAVGEAYAYRRALCRFNIGPWRGENFTPRELKRYEG